MSTQKGDTRDLVLRGEKPTFTVQDYYAGVHWTKRSAEARRMHAQVRQLLDPDLPPFDGQVAITITAVQRTHPLDSSNIPVKIYEDALKGWWIRDDNPYWVKSIKGVSVHDPDADEDSIVIHLVQVTDPYPCVCSGCDGRFPNKKSLRSHQKAEACGYSIEEV